MGEITPKNEGNAGSHGGWLVIYYFKLFQVSNHHRDHVPLYGFFRRKRKDDQPSLPIIRCWWVVICWFKYYFKQLVVSNHLKHTKLDHFPMKGWKYKNWNHHSATFKVWQQFRKEIASLPNPPEFLDGKNSNLGSSWCCPSTSVLFSINGRSRWGSLAVLFWSFFSGMFVPKETKWSWKKFSDLTHVHAITLFFCGREFWLIMTHDLSLFCFMSGALS